MSKSKASRARESARIDRQLAKSVSPDLPPDIKISIANVARGFDFTNAKPGGTCLARAVIGRAVLRVCGLRSRLIAGGMLYRCGPHPRRDTIRFCLPHNQGGYLNGHLIGHVWNEVGDDLIDFSCGDWQRESDLIYAIETDVEDRALGPIEWTEPPPPFIWQPALGVKAGWRSSGEPDLGRIWYGEWSADKLPDYASHAEVVRSAMPHIREHVANIRLIERIAAVT